MDLFRCFFITYRTYVLGSYKIFDYTHLETGGSELRVEQKFT